MAMTGLSDVEGQVKTFWSDMFVDELKESALLARLVNKDYSGEIFQNGTGTVRVSQLTRGEANIKKFGEGHEYFSSEKIQTKYIDIKADHVVSYAIEIDDIVELSSQIKLSNSKIRQNMVTACELKINDFLYSLIAPSAANPDHRVSGVSDLNGPNLNMIRTLAARARWPKDGGWWMLSDPSHYSDLLNSQTLTSSDYVGEDRPVIGGQIVNKRYNFNMLEETSPALISAMQRLTGSTNDQDASFAFHPDFLHLVMPRRAEFELSRLHPNHQFGWLLSVRFIIGGALGFDSDKLSILAYNT